MINIRNCDGWHFQTMNTVGLIAHASSGKDIRRLVASGTVVTNQEKINTIVRMLLAMDAAGVSRVEIMPDTTGIGRRAIAEVQDQLKQLEVDICELPYLTGTAADTLRTAELMHQRAFACVIVMGGDGTCRVASKGLRNTPMVPVSTGTNNVFPQQVEGTLVGLAVAAFCALEQVRQQCLQPAPRLELVDDNGLIDIALVDLVVVGGRDTAARAVWDPELIRELFLLYAKPDSLGLSSIGAWLAPMVAENRSQGMHIRTGTVKHQIQAPIAPGLICELPIASCESFGNGDSIALQGNDIVIALDGEREVSLSAHKNTRVCITDKGPLVVDIKKALDTAAQRGFLLSASQNR